MIYIRNSYFKPFCVVLPPSLYHCLRSVWNGEHLLQQTIYSSRVFKVLNYPSPFISLPGIVFDGSVLLLPHHQSFQIYNSKLSISLAWAAWYKPDFSWCGLSVQLLVLLCKSQISDFVSIERMLISIVIILHSITIYIPWSYQGH